MYYPNNSYLNRVGYNRKPSQETLDKRAFDKAMIAEADRMLAGKVANRIGHGMSFLQK